MKNERSFSQHVFIIPFVSYTNSKLMTYFFSEVSMVSIFITTALIFSVIYFTAHTIVVNTIINLAVALHLTNIISYLFSHTIPDETSVRMGIIAITIFLILCILPLLIANKHVLSLISESLLAVGSATSLLMLMQNFFSVEVLVRLFPIVVSCIYVMLSNKVEHGISILMSNTITSLAVAYLLIFFAERMDMLPTVSVYEAVVAITWLATIAISFLYNDKPFPGFKLGYQRFLNEKKEIKHDIYTLKKSISNANELSNDELFNVINPLKNIPLEKNIKELLIRTVTRYDLQEKRKEMKSTTWLLVFCAYILYIAVSIYAYRTYNIDYLIFFIFGPMYFLSVPYLISLVLYKNMIRFVNKNIIDPFNKLISVRKTLIENIKDLLQERGYTEMTTQEFEDVYLLKIEKNEKQIDTPIELKENNAI